MREIKFVLFAFLFLLGCFTKQAQCQDYRNYDSLIEVNIRTFHQDLQFEVLRMERFLEKFEKDAQVGLKEWIVKLFSGSEKSEEEKYGDRQEYDCCAFWKCEERHYEKWRAKGINICCYDTSKSHKIKYHEQEPPRDVIVYYEDEENPLNTLKGAIYTVGGTHLEPPTLKCLFLLVVGDKLRENICKNCHNKSSEWYVSYTAYTYSN